MKKRQLFPPDIKTVREDKHSLLELYRKKRVRPGDFVGITELEGSFLVEEPEAMLDSLKPGEELVLTYGEPQFPLENVTITVSRKCGAELGTLPYSSSILPNALRRHGIRLFCYLECCELEDKMPAVAVSLYCKGL